MRSALFRAEDTTNHDTWDTVGLRGTGSHDFSVENVALHSNSQLPTHYRFAATWGSHEGSLLLWSLMLAGWGAAVTFFSRHLPTTLRARVLAVMGLIAVGFLMCQHIVRIDFHALDTAIPAFVLLVTIPFTYSISHGIGYGFITYTVIKLLSRDWRAVHPLMYVTALGFLLYFIFD